MDIEWEIARRELKRCLTEEKSRAHSAFKLAQIKQKPNENLRIFILRYQDLHAAATGKTAAEDTDPTHIIRFLGMMTNSPGTGNVTTRQGQVRYIRVPPGTTRTTYNLRSTPLNNVATVRAPATGTTAVAPVTVGRGGGSPQVVQVKQEPAPPGNVATPKASSTVIRRGKRRSQKTSTISVVEAMPEENEYFVEVGEEDLEGSDSDPTELYEILAEITGPEEEIEEGLEPEIEPPI